MKKNQYLGHGSGTSHRHRTQILEMLRPEIVCYIGIKTNKISSHERERHITYWSFLLGKFNKGYGNQHAGNASGATNPTATHCHPYCASGAQGILQLLVTISTDGICSGLHRSWHPKNWVNFQISKECADNRQELLAGMMYWSKTNGIEIDTAVFFFNMAIEDMV